MITKCIFCNENNSLKIFEENRSFLTCNKCGITFNEKRIQYPILPVDENYTPTILKRIRNKISLRFDKMYCDECLRYLKSKTDMKFNNALDIGARHGLFVKEFNKLGIDTHGIEPDKGVLKFSVTDKIEQCSFDENYDSKIKYDLICFSNMIFYYFDTSAILKHAKNMLTKNGLILIATINPQALHIKSHLFVIQDYQNMLFSKANYESLKNRLGLELIDYSMLRNNLSLDVKLYGKKRIHLIKYYLKLKKVFERDPDGSFILLLLKPC